MEECDNRLIAFNEKGLQIWDNMYQSLEMGYSKENLSNTNLCLYYFIATFLFPDRQLNEKKQDTKDISARLTIEDMACLLLYSSEVKIKEVALAVGYEDPYYFSRLFKKYLNLSPDQYRVLRRKEP